ncbi:MAG: hypothetical protein JW744_00495 [Candidatus Diapherotrites archaeon]|uniref:Uncharacterized protein n=1 Tax=Candidatus Iainarchaeum sp. TaxID=3101447 RepID=A0A938YTL8_9ARCH|nr:hypothetical protein [Candidatus Diapherotrites archaeon]
MAAGKKSKKTAWKKGRNAVRSLRTKRAVFRLSDSNAVQKAALFGGGSAAYFGVLASAAGHKKYGIPAAAAGAAVLGAFCALMRKGNEAIESIDADIIGRPALAKRAFGKLSTKEREGHMAIANIPHLTSTELEYYFKTAKAEGKTDVERGFKNFRNFRIFSREEVEQLRKEWRAVKSSPKAFQKLEKKLFRMAGEKREIVGCAAAEPELTSIIFNELLPPIGKLDMQGRQAAIRSIQQATVLPEGAALELTGKSLKGQPIKITLTRTRGKHWDMRKIIAKGKK